MEELIMKKDMMEIGKKKSWKRYVNLLKDGENN